MRTRSVLLAFGCLLGAALGQVATALTPVIPIVAHPGASLQQIESAYVDAYEQSGFRLADRLERDALAGTRIVHLTFELTGTAQADNAPGTMLEIVCDDSTPSCGVMRLSFVFPAAGDPDPVVRKRGETTLAVADAAALAKVRRRLGVSLPDMLRMVIPAR